MSAVLDTPATAVADTPRVADLDAPWSREWLVYVWSSIPGVALAVAAMAGWVGESIALALFALSFVGLNLMHMAATWTRVYVRPGWRTNPLERLHVPLALAASAVAYEAIGGGALLLAAQYFLSFHHALMQNYGLVRASQRRTRRTIDSRLDMAACLLLPGAALLYRADMVCNLYTGAQLPTVPLVLVQAMAAAGALALVAFAWREMSAHRRGEHVDPIAGGLLFGTNLLWATLLVTDPHPAFPLYALATGHYAQYLWFVWRVEARDGALAPAAGITPRLHAELRSSRLRFLAVLLAIGGTVVLLLTFASAGLRASAEALAWRPVGSLDLPAWTAAMIGVNLHHYWLDHRIWRSRATTANAAAA